MQDAILKEIYEKPGKKKMASAFVAKRKSGDKPSGVVVGGNTDATDFKKNAIARRIAKMAPKPGANDKDKAGK